MIETSILLQAKDEALFIHTCLDSVVIPTFSTELKVIHIGSRASLATGDYELLSYAALVNRTDSKLENNGFHKSKLFSRRAI